MLNKKNELDPQMLALFRAGIPYEDISEFIGKSYEPTHRRCNSLATKKDQRFRKVNKLILEKYLASVFSDLVDAIVTGEKLPVTFRGL